MSKSNSPRSAAKPQQTPVSQPATTPAPLTDRERELARYLRINLAAEPNFLYLVRDISEDRGFDVMVENSRETIRQLVDRLDPNDAIAVANLVRILAGTQIAPDTWRLAGLERRKEQGR